ncbi:MAG: metal-dependent transcriptional regulator [Anaerolineae bacterium]|nr:metal-dependent transcriptional regulator [Anaerolineae bacterium]
MTTILSQSIEDYLKAIYEIAGEDRRASTTELAEYLNVAPASVTGMIKKLSETTPPLVNYVKHQGVTLTPEGNNVALETLRHHRLLELFLHQILDYPWDEVHEEADRLEHVISEKFEERIAVALGNPKHDPHGDPIPRRDLSLPFAAATSLSELRPGQIAVVKRVRDTDPKLLRYLSENGVIPGAEIEVIHYSEFDGNLQLRVQDLEGSPVLGPLITEQIYVEVLN